MAFNFKTLVGKTGSTLRGIYNWMSTYFSDRFNDLNDFVTGLVFLFQHDDQEIEVVQHDEVVEIETMLTKIAERVPTITAVLDGIPGGVAIPITVVEHSEVLGSNATAIRFHDQEVFALEHMTGQIWVAKTIVVGGITKKVDEIISSLKESCGISDVIATISSYYSRNGSLSTSDIKAQFDAAYTKLPGAVSSFLSQCLTVIGQSGPWGFVMALKDGWSNISSSLHATSVNRYSFTDNSGFVPDIYLSGLVEGIGSAISSLVTAIATIFSRVAGVIIGVLGSGLVKVLGLWFDRNSSQYNVELDLNADLGCLPLAFCQHKIHIPSSSPAYVMMEKHGVVYREVPGGILLMWIVPDGSGDACIEFHPSCFVQYGAVGIDSNEELVGKFWMTDSQTKRVSPDRRSVQDVIDEYGRSRVTDPNIYQGLTASEQTKVAAQSLVRAVSWFVTWMAYVVLEHEGWSDDVISAFSWRLTKDDVKRQPADREFTDYLSISTEAGTGQYYRAEHYGKFIIDALYVLAYIDDNATSATLENIINAAVATDAPNYAPGKIVVSNSGVYTIAEICNICFAEFLIKRGEIEIQSFPYEELWWQQGVDEYEYVEVGSASYVLTPPSASYGKTMALTIAVGAAIAAVSVAAVYATVKIKKFIDVKSIKARTDLETKWQNMVENKDDPNAASAYRAAAKKYNRTWGLLTGTKYNFTDYWGEVESSDVDLEESASAITVSANTETILQLLGTPLKQ